MWVHDEIRSPSGLRERHIFLGHDETADTFLTVSTRKFITELRTSHLAGDGLYDCVLVVGGENDPVYVVVAAVAFENAGLGRPGDRLL